LLVAGALATVSIGWKDEAEGEILMPQLVGADVLSATSKLEELGLRWRFGGSDFVSSHVVRPEPGVVLTPSPAEDEVLAQDPDAGSRVEPGHVVELRSHCSESAEAGTPCF
jgi:hypothetical protein